MNILFASSNMHKAKELEQLLTPHILHLPSEFGLSFDCEETGTTFIENALQKAQALFCVSSHLGMPILADDSGLEVDALDGAPGIHTARYGSKPGEPVLSAHDKNLLLLSNLNGVPEEKRTARFVCALVLLYPDGRTVKVQEKAEGRILFSETGIHGFGYDPVFYSNEACSCFAILTPESKGMYGHRGKAALSLLRHID